jgi:hypothetical protein
VNRLLNEELGWLGLGPCVKVDYSSELTFTAIAVDESLGIAAVCEALGRAGHLDGAVIAVERFRSEWPRVAAQRTAASTVRTRLQDSRSSITYRASKSTQLHHVKPGQPLRRRSSAIDLSAAMTIG